MTPPPDAPPEAASPEPSQPFLVTAAPHVRSAESIPRIMWTVNAALVPAVAWGTYVFGLRALWCVALGVGSAVATEALLQLWRRRPVTVGDGSAVLTGLLVALVFPVHLPWYCFVTGSVFGIAVAKQAFGGLGCNIWNPALAGRAFVLAAWAALATVGAGWPVPFHYARETPAQAAGSEAGQEQDAAASEPAVDAVTAPTPLTRMEEGLREHKDAVEEEVRAQAGEAPRKPTYPRSPAQARQALRRIQEERGTPVHKLLLGLVGGCIGEVSAVALLLGGLVLIALGYVKWEVPLFYIATLALLAWALPVPVAGAKMAYSEAAGQDVVRQTTCLVWFAGRPLFEIFAGGLFLGAFFMATDMVTSPVTRGGLILFAVGCGVLTAVIRRYGGYPEGVCYAILLMNSAVPLIDRFTKHKVFGQRASS
ncbi:MAG: RnfABCDGE type electron transport complex subunit D [Candidatus Brocadiia bacterium]